MSATHLWLHTKLGNLEASCHWSEVPSPKPCAGRHENPTPSHQRGNTEKWAKNYFVSQANQPRLLHNDSSNQLSSPTDTKTANYWKFPKGSRNKCMLGHGQCGIKQFLETAMACWERYPRNHSDSTLLITDPSSSVLALPTPTHPCFNNPEQIPLGADSEKTEFLCSCPVVKLG